MKKTIYSCIFVLILAFSGYIVFVSQKKNTLEDHTTKLENHFQKRNITVIPITEDRLDNMRNYFGEGLSKITPITLEDYHQALIILAPELDKYPQDKLPLWVNTIYIGYDAYTKEGFSSKNLSGMSGTYNLKSKTLYFFPFLAKAPDYRRFVFTGTIHHELSSLITRMNNFKDLAWIDLNSEGIEVYWAGSKPVYHAHLDDESLSDEELWDKGMISLYGKTNVENDINEYVEKIFSDPNLVITASQSSESVLKKYLFIRDFYLSISTVFKPVFEPIDKELNL